MSSVLACKVLPHIIGTGVNLDRKSKVKSHEDKSVEFEGNSLLGESCQHDSCMKNSTHSENEDTKYRWFWIAINL